MRAPRRLILTGLALLLAAGVLLIPAACRDHRAEDAAPPKEPRESVDLVPADSVEERAVPLEVITAPARDGDLVLWLPATGQVHADASITVRPQVAGTVVQLLVRPGDRVVAGQRLLQLDTIPFALALRDTEARLEEAEQRLLESIAPESLVTGLVPSASRRLALARHAGVPVALVARDRARYERSRTEVRSPIAGIVDRVVAAAGDPVGPGQPLVTVVDLQRLTVEAQVFEHDLPLLRPGHLAQVTTPGAPGAQRVGRIATLLPVVDSAAHAGRVLIPLRGDGALKPGMAAELQLEAVRLRRRRLVPTAAILERDGRALVFVVNGGRAQWTTVLPGRSNGRETELLPDSSTGEIAVRPGDQVIVDGHLTLAHDAAVHAMPARAMTSAVSRRPRRP